MKLLRNYVLRELLSPLLMSVLTLTFIFLLGNVVKIADLVLNRGVDFFELIKFLSLIIPEMLIFTLPTSVLATILLVFGDLSQNNEIVALRAHGVNIFRVMVPIILCGLLLSVVVLILTDQVVPRYSFTSRKVLKAMFLKDPFAYIKPGVPTKMIDEYVFLAREVSNDILRNVTVYQTQNDKPTRTILADRCEVIRSANGSSVKIRLYDGTIDEPDKDDTKVFNKLDFKVYELPILDLENVNNIKRKTREFSIDELIRKLRVEKLTPEDRREYIIEIHKKISFSFGCFIFTLIGLPIAIITRRGNMIVSFGLAISVLTVYYVLFSWAQAVAVQGVLPPEIALWLPFSLFFIVGCILMYKVVKA